MGRPLRIGSADGNGSLPAGLARASRVAEVVLVVLVAVVLVAMAAALLVVFVRGLARIRVLRMRGAVADVPDAYDAGELVDDEGTEPMRRRLLRQLELSEDALGAGAPQEVVIACYLALLDAVAAGGTPPRPHETPTELLERVLAERDVSPPAVRALTDLYREARYSSHVIDSEMRAAAHSALATARRELAG